MLAEILNYFSDDPMRALYLAGGTGGLWFWIQEWRNRVRVRVWLLSEQPYVSTAEMDERSILTFEAENIGTQATSVEPLVSVRAYTARRQRIERDGKVLESERDLQPFQAKTLSVQVKANPDHTMLVFRTYHFRFTRGASRTVRVWSAHHRTVNWFRFQYERARFLKRGEYREPGT
ncbi:hypothetical protein QWY84_07750 [Aquisalimonas lutea]|uniref:hypothetical protein n=1 Tax=Aquisalimonas lutea TaxID=1327750 RepID=UPI0025B3BF7A|nr:hypothetical protein [Aquisalimonas lutea]MDN3517497.1 hypothetical protein [Aquisalimonas lutea]